MRSLRLECSGGQETKLGAISETRYAAFLRDVSRLRGVAFAVAVDAGLQTEEGLLEHRDGQAGKVLVHVDKMVYPEGRLGLENLAAAIRALPVQLYAQLICQIELFHDVIARGITYFAQRHPPTLGKLRWRVDRKDTIPTAYEQAFRQILPALLQTKSQYDPMLMLTEGADYRFFERYEYAPGEAPTYLKDDYGLDFGNEGGANVGKMVSEDFELVDSNQVPGVQVADLIASGLRRTFRGNFDDPDRIASLLGANLLQKEDRPPVKLISLGTDDAPVSDRSAELLRLMTRRAKAYLTAR